MGLERVVVCKLYAVLVVEGVLPHVICERRVLHEKGKEERKRGRKSPFRPTVILHSYFILTSFFSRKRKSPTNIAFTPLFKN